jgi:hypothetical protein
LAEYRALQSRLNANVTHTEAFQVLKMVTNVDFGLMKFARKEMPQAVHESVFKSLKDIIDYTPYPPGSARSRATEPDSESPAPMEVESTGIVMSQPNGEKVMISASGLESLQDSNPVMQHDGNRRSAMEK